MQVKLAHPKYHSFIQTQDEAKLISSSAELPLSTTTVLDSSVTLNESTIHIVLQVNDKALIHWYGNEELKSQPIELATGSISGVQLITDLSGGVHLFYLQKQIDETGYTIFHQRFTGGQWGDMIRVSANISSSPQHWQVSYGLDGYLHLVYLSQQRDVILYRVFDLETNLWSGAISLVRETSDFPKLYPTSKGMLLVWVGRNETEQTLKVMVQDGKWSKPHTLAGPSESLFQSGVELSDDMVTIGWQEGDKYCSASYDKQWSSSKPVEMSKYKLEYQTIMALDGKGCSTWAIYQKSKPVTTEVSPPAETSPKAETTSKAKAEAPPQPEELKAQKQAEHRFFQEAFSLHQEWEKMKSKYQQFENRLDQLAKEKETVTTISESSLENTVKKLTEDIGLINERISVIRTELTRLRTKPEPAPKRSLEKSLNTQLHTLEQKVSRLETAISKLENDFSSSKFQSIQEEPHKRSRSLIRRFIFRK